MFFLFILLIVLLAGTAFFSGAETALFSLSRHDLAQFRRDKRRGHQLVAQLMQRPRKILLTLMIGNVTINMFVFATSIVMLHRVPENIAFLAPVLGIVSPVVLTLVADVVPKGVAILAGKELAAYLAPLIRIIQIGLSPAAQLLDAIVTPLTRLLVRHSREEEFVTIEELQQLVEMSERRQMIDADENAMLSEALELGRLKVRDVMVHRTDVIAFEVHDDPEELKRLVRENGFSKLPVYDANIDHVVGLVYAKDLFLHRHRGLRELIRPIHFVPEIINLTQLLTHFRKTRTQLAIAVDEYGGMTGVVTVEDVAQQIVGEIAPGEDESPLWERLDARHYRVSGSMSVREWAQQFHVPGLTDDVTTLGGLILSRLGRPAQVGDHIRLRNLMITVNELKGRRIEWVSIELLDGHAVAVPGAAS
jgi:putative hemolysin